MREHIERRPGLGRGVPLGARHPRGESFASLGRRWACPSYPTRCASTEMAVAEGCGPVAELTPSASVPSRGDALRRWNTNANGRISCREARDHDIAPLRREDPSYRFIRDRDAMVCCENRVPQR